MHKIEKIHLYDKILSPVVTEKSTNLSEIKKDDRNESFSSIF